MPRSELHAHPQWRRTGNACFPVAALVDGQWWVLRINGFPDHPLWTLFISGTARFDLDDAPPAWGSPADQSAPVLEAGVVEGVLASIRDLVAYGSEVGEPCDDPFCCG